MWREGGEDHYENPSTTYGYWGPSNLVVGENSPAVYAGDHHHGLMPYQDGAEDFLEDDFDHSRIISLSSVTKLCLLGLMGVLLSYAAVSPRSAPTDLYNYLFKVNLLLLCSSLAGPLFYMGVLYSAKDVNVNELVSMVFSAATTGYVLACGAEVVGATAIRALAFLMFEPEMVKKVCPEIPLIYLPWLWKKLELRPKFATLFFSDLIVNCGVAPLIEEGVKFLIFRWCSIRQGWGRDRRDLRRTVHSYLVYMVGVSMGLKLADNTRRILLYTKPKVSLKDEVTLITAPWGLIPWPCPHVPALLSMQQTSKPFFAVARGFFPVQEFCGAFTAMNLARREILEENVPWWMILLPATILHSMANFRVSWIVVDG